VFTINKVAYYNDRHRTPNNDVLGIRVETGPASKPLLCAKAIRSSRNQMRQRGFGQARPLS